mgnify:CR=1 FL=1
MADTLVYFSVGYPKLMIFELSYTYLGALIVLETAAALSILYLVTYTSEYRFSAF